MTTETITKRGRKPLPSAVAPAIELNEDQVRADLQAADALPGMLAAIKQNAQALARELAYEGALTVESLEEEIKFYLRRSVEAVLEMGKRLLLLKEVAGHGNFVERIEALGIGYRMAARFMASTLKFSKVTSTTLLALPNLNQGKLLELLVLDDGEIEALNAGDEVRGIQLDDVDCMSVSELRRALRQEKADKEAAITKVKAEVSGQLSAKDKLIADKSKRIAELVEEKNSRESLTEGERRAFQEKRLNDAAFEAVTHLLPLRQAILEIQRDGTTALGLMTAMEGALQRVVAEVTEIAAENGIALQVVPEWAIDTEAQPAGALSPSDAGSDWIEATAIKQ